MLVPPISKSQRLVRPLCTGSVKAGFDTSQTIPRFAQLGCLAAKVLPRFDGAKPGGDIPPISSNNEGPREHDSEILPNCSDPVTFAQFPLEARFGSSCEALRHQQPAAGWAATNDVCLSLESSCIGVPHGNKLFPDEPGYSSQSQSLTQREWERLWYGGVSVAFAKFARHFPELPVAASETAVSSNIAEPGLALSSLKVEDRAIFEEEESVSAESLFAPKSEEQRLRRLHCAQRVASETQRQALILGLPTFDEYIEKKREEESQLQDLSKPWNRRPKREAKWVQKEQHRTLAKANGKRVAQISNKQSVCPDQPVVELSHTEKVLGIFQRGVMTHERKSSKESTPLVPAQHRPLVVGLTKPQSARSVSTMASSSEAAALNKEIEKNVKSNTAEAAPSEENPTAPVSQKPKKEKAPKQPKPPKAAAPVAPTSPALIDLRVGHILRAIAHPNADSLYVSTIAMGDAEGTEHTQVDEETGKVVRTVCSGLNGLLPLEEMQNRKIVVVANLKPVNMRSIKSAAMVLAASPKQPEGADPHAADRVVELVQPPEDSEAGDKVYFEGWPYGDGKGPEKVLNPKKKQWEAIQPGFYTSEDLIVGFDASLCEEVEGAAKGNLVVEGKGPCTVKTLRGAIVR